MKMAVVVRTPQIIGGRVRVKLNTPKKQAWVQVFIFASLTFSLQKQRPHFPSLKIFSIKISVYKIISAI